MKIVLDTNVLINGVQDNNSYAYRIIQACLEGKLTPLISHRIKRENRLLVKRTVIDQEYKDTLDEFYDQAEMVRVTSRLNAVPEDREDNKFIECAVDGQADYIISEDNHLLDISPHQGIDVLTPSQFWQRQGEEIGGGSEWQDWMKMLMGNK